MNTPLFWYSGLYNLEKGTFVLPRSFSQIDDCFIEQFSCVRCQETIDDTLYRFLRFFAKQEKQMHEEEGGPVRLLHGKVRKLALSYDDISFAGLEREVMYVGCGEAFELWKPNDFVLIENCYWMFEKKFA